MRSTKYGLGLAVAAACMAIGAGSASAATRYVDDTGGSNAANDCLTQLTPCATIDYAVGQAANDDTVDVAAGTYTELVNVNKPLIIKGAQPGVDARTRNVPAAQETVVNGAGGSFNIPGSNVTLDGLTVSGNTDGNVLGAGIAMSSAGSNRRLLNTIVQDNIIGLSLNNAEDAATVIRHNRFADNDNPGAAGGTGLYGDAGIDNVTIDENTFSGNPNGSMILSSTGNTRNDDVAVTDNTFGNSTLLISLSDSDVTGNSFTDSDFSGVLLDSVRDVSFRDNSVQNAGSAGVRVANFYGTGPSQNLEIVGNTIAGNNSDNVPDRGGIRVDDDGYAGVLDVGFNRIVDNTGSGVNNASNEARVNAENNWWGCNAGANSADCDTTTGNDVDATPHLVLGLTATPDLIQTSGTSTLKADLSVNSNGEDFAAPPFPNTPVAFSATGGAVANATRTLQDGGATTTYTAGGSQGTFAGTATLDGQPASAVITVKNPTNGTAGGQGPAGATGPQGSTGTQGTQGTQGTTGLTPSSSTGKLSLVSKSLKANKKRKVTVSISCPTANRLCDGRLNLLQGRKILARQSFLVRGGRSGKVTFTLSRKAYKALKKSQKVKVDSFSRDLAGAASESSKSLTLTK